jgi:hypothetical protein
LGELFEGGVEELGGRIIDSEEMIARGRARRVRTSITLYDVQKYISTLGFHPRMAFLTFLPPHRV